MIAISRCGAPIAALACAALLAACGQKSSDATPAPGGVARSSTSVAAASITSARAVAVPTGAATAASARTSSSISAADSGINHDIDQVLGDHAAYKDVFERLQQAVAANDKAAVAALVAYPLKPTGGARYPTVNDARQFIAEYDRIITPEIASAITAQKYANLFVNQQGVMLGNGEVWISGVCRDSDSACSHPDVKVMTIQPVPPTN